MIIVIGGSGYIGEKLCEYFSKKNKLLAGTYCNSPKEGLQHFDLENPDLNKLNVDIKKAKYAIITSSINRPDDCKANEEKAHKINVQGTKKLIEQLFEKGIVPVFLSSGYAFSGEKGNYSESDETNPNTIYGTHKKIIEDFLLKSGKPFLIARISKIFGLIPGDKTFLTSLVEQFKNNETVKCATDQIFSFTYVDDFVKALDLAIEKKLNGCYNIASPEIFSKFELAKLLKSKLEIKSGEIVSCSINDFKFLDSRPLDTSLKSDKIIKETGFEFTKMETCIDKLRG